MLKTSPPAENPPAGKSLVLIHYPGDKKLAGTSFTGVWEGTNFIADLGAATSAAYICESGRHYFVSRNEVRVGAVEANLLSDHTYCLWVQRHGNWAVMSFQIEPLKRGTPEWDKVPTQAKEHMWVMRGPTAAEHEALRRTEVERILKDFVSGDKQDRLRHLDAEDYR